MKYANILLYHLVVAWPPPRLHQASDSSFLQTFSTGLSSAQTPQLSSGKSFHQTLRQQAVVHWPLLVPLHCDESSWLQLVSTDWSLDHSTLHCSVLWHHPDLQLKIRNPFSYRRIAIKGGDSSSWFSPIIFRNPQIRKGRKLGNNNNKYNHKQAKSWCKDFFMHIISLSSHNVYKLNSFLTCF